MKSHYFSCELADGQSSRSGYIFKSQAIFVSEFSFLSFSITKYGQEGFVHFLLQWPWTCTHDCGSSPRHTIGSNPIWMWRRNCQYLFLTKKKERTRQKLWTLFSRDLDLAHIAISENYDTSSDHKQYLFKVKCFTKLDWTKIMFFSSQWLLACLNDLG